MKKQLKNVTSLTLGLTLALSWATSSFAAADTGWTTSSKLYEIRTWAGKSDWGHANGSVKTASFFHPRSVVGLPDGKLLVADNGNHLLRTLTAEQVSAYAGLTLGEDDAGLPIGAFHDAALSTAAFQQPSGLAIDSQGNVYVADTGNNAIRKINKEGKVTTLAGNGKIGLTNGIGSEVTFDHPSDVAVDARGNVYVADTLNHAIRKIAAADGRVTTLTAPSTRVVEYFPGAVEDAGDFLDGPIATAKFNEPSGLAVDDKGNLYVSDRGNQRIRYIDFSTGQVTTVAGGGNYGKQASYVEGDYVDGAASVSRFNAPEGLTVTSDGTVVVADSLNHAIRLIKSGQVTTLAGVGTEFGQTDGLTGSAQFNHPTDVTVLADGRLAIADEYGNKVRVLQKYAKPANLPTGTIPVLLNGKLLSSDVPAQNRSNYIFLPVRAVTESLGYTVKNNNKTGEAFLTKGDVTFTVKNGSNTVVKSVKGEKTTLTLNAAAFITRDRMFLPVRFFAEQNDLDIQWDNEARIVVIRNKTF
ncbi:copper amine oxidase [Cohnella sp. CFH 77786]|uniref:stalk domain-containing protein n=1 Tax=Cohnella sp. CFH 77786 TaxID=2662265 RepID=UPI001C60DAC2|nr:stalk domain-containing protein [Cohnella sp. CFH 77786]MBW5445101.1 copper amine oxidase [Cohnella sp. CFH 77786]